MFFLPILAIVAGLGTSTVGGIGIAAGGTAHGLSAFTVTALGATTGGLIGGAIDHALDT